MIRTIAALPLAAMLIVVVGLDAPRATLAGESDLRAGFAAVEITPMLGGPRPTYIAGYGPNRKAKGVHDPLYARAVVLAHQQQRIAIVSLDLIGLQYPAVKAIRAKLPEIDYVLVCSTHNHEGPDVIGIWGRGPFHRGVDDAYVAAVIERTAECVKQAAGKLSSVTAEYGTAEDESLLADTRLPIVKDGVLRVVKLHGTSGNKAAGLIVQWNCHPESLGPRNLLLTADFPWATVRALEKSYGCPVVYLSGALGGLMTHPTGRVFASDGRELAEGSYEYAERYGEEVAALASRAIAQAQPLGLVPLTVSARPIAVPVRNSLYRAARGFGVIQREGLVWTGDFQSPGEPMTPETADKESAVESEVAYLRLGELHVACIPGELYPELVYGKFENPAAAGADFPTAPLEPTIAELMPSPKWLLVGLANDELGYILPQRQWDKEAPHAYDKDGGQYGEINSCGHDVAPIVMEALKRRVAEAR
jgi:hypothetical protein